MSDWFSTNTRSYETAKPPVIKTIIDVSTLSTWPELYADHDNLVYYTKSCEKIKSMLQNQSPSSAPITINAILNDKIVLYQGDITALKCDAIVNAANTGLWPGGGICGAIHDAAGAELAAECKLIKHCDTGDTVITNAYKLPCKYVLHSVGPTNQSPEELCSCYQTILARCVENNIRSVCICCISTGIYGFPRPAATLFALQTIRKCFEADSTLFDAMDRIVFCTFLPEDTEYYAGLIQYIFPLNTEMESLTMDEPTAAALEESVQDSTNLNDDDNVIPSIVDNNSTPN
jgi:O-acetyl-ADP-ribose deacetylase (regulator of RNase III)